MSNENTAAIAHLESLRADVREEIKKRIEQRDKYSIQLTIALAAIIGFSFARGDQHRILIAAPLVSIYFTMLIMYSYQVHKLLAEYLREAIEPALSDLCGTALDLEWEHYYREHATPGIRRTFFIWALWVVTLFSMAFLFIEELGNRNFIIILIIASTVYLFASVWITKKALVKDKKNVEDQPRRKQRR